MDLKKLQFWKKDKELDLSELDFDKQFPRESAPASDPERLASVGQQDFAFPQLPGEPQGPPQMTVRELPQQIPQGMQGMQNRDMELIAAKLDTIKAMLDSINTRLQNLEELGRQQRKQQW